MKSSAVPSSDEPAAGTGHDAARPPDVGATTEYPRLAEGPPPPLDHAGVRAIVVGIMLAMFLSALEQTIVGPALTTIGRQLADVENLSWVVTAYLLSATAVTPLFGKLSDIYGRRIIMLIAVGIFLVGSVACALAPDMLTLILARALQGIGGGGILPLAQTVIADLVSPRERPRYQSYTSVMFVGASILGPVLGGFLTDHLHWSLIFWINLPLGLAALVMTDRALRRLPRNERPHKLDVLGGVIMVAAAMTLMLALTWGGTRHAWTSLPIIGLMAGSSVLWVLFGLRLATAQEPFIPSSMLSDPVVAPITSVAFFSIGTVIGLSIMVPLYLDLVMGLSASASGVVMITWMVGTVVGSFTAGRTVARLARYRRVPVVGLLLGIAPLLVFAWKPAGLSLHEVAMLLALSGCGLGTLYPVTTIVIQNVVPPHQLGTATGTLNFFRLLGGAIIVAVFGAIVVNALGAPAGAVALERMPSGIGAGAEMAAAFRWVFIAAVGFLLAALVSVLLTPERPLQGPSSEVRIAE